METFNYKNHSIRVFYFHDGNRMFIYDPRGVQIWAHKFSGTAEENAKFIIDLKAKSSSESW